MITRPIMVFLVLATLFAAGGYYLAIYDGGAAKGPGLLIVQFAPMLAAFISAFWCRRNLRGFGWGWGKWRYQALAWILPLIIASITFSLVWIFGFGKLQPGPFIVESQTAISEMFGIKLSSSVATIAAVLALNSTIGLLIAFGAVGEELGWRGFLTPELMKQMSFTKASLIGGTIWTLYHVPLLVWILAPRLEASALPLILSSLIAGIALTFILNWLRLRSGSVWTAVIFHAALNLHNQGFFENITASTSDLTRYVSGQHGAMFAAVTAVAALVFWVRRDQLPRTNESNPKEGTSQNI